MLIWGKQVFSTHQIFYLLDSAPTTVFDEKIIVVTITASGEAVVHFELEIVNFWELGFVDDLIMVNVYLANM